MSYHGSPKGSVSKAAAYGQLLRALRPESIPKKEVFCIEGKLFCLASETGAIFNGFEAHPTGMNTRSIRAAFGWALARTV